MKTGKRWTLWLTEPDGSLIRWADFSCREDAEKVGRGMGNVQPLIVPSRCRRRAEAERKTQWETDGRSVCETNK